VNTAQRSNTRTVAANSFWYGLDSLLSIVLSLATSIPLARAIGPERLGYFSYVLWLVTASASLGSLGVPGTAGKFLAEMRGRQDSAGARAVYRWALKWQTVFAGSITLAGLAIVFAAGDPRYRVVSAILVTTVFPTMLNGVATQANLANESMRSNVPASIASNLIYLFGVLLSLWLGWDLLGVAITVLVSKTVDFTARWYATRGWIGDGPAAKLPQELRAKMRSFANHQVVLALMAVIIWDKSDILLLKYFSKDIAQITFFTVAFNLSEKGILLPRVIGASMDATLVAQYGRDRSRLAEMTGLAGR
jgi:O-antigen/teichoic acid export membrane protein